MEALGYLRVVLAFSAAFIPLFALETLAPIRPGIYVGAAELFIEGFAIFQLWRGLRHWHQLSVTARRFLLASFVSLFIADFFYILFFYIFSFDYKEWWTVSLTTVFYGLQFLTAAAAMTAALEKNLRDHFFKPVALIPILLLVPITGKFVFFPYVQTFMSSELSTYLLAQGFVITAGFICAAIAFLVLVSARTLFWSALSIGLLTLIFSDWALRVEVFRGHTPAFGFYEYYWGFGVLLTALPLICLKCEVKPIERFALYSLLCSYKLGNGSLILILIAFLSWSQYGNDEAIKIISLGCSLGTLVTTVVSHFLAERVAMFARELAQIVGDDVHRAHDGTRLDRQELPLELAESFSLVFDSRVAAEHEKKKQEHSIQLAKTRLEIASQVAHDIKSPLAALQMVAQDSEDLPEDLRIILRSASNRIRDIANALLERNRAKLVGSEEPMTVQQLSYLLEEVVAEKKMQLRIVDRIGIETDFGPEGECLFARVQAGEFKRMVSNLFDNAVEAIRGTGGVQLRMSCEGDEIRIEFVDDGVGISDLVLARLGERGVTIGKASGSGLGLHHARQSLEAWGGSLSAKRRRSWGSRVLAKLQRTQTPAWFVDGIRIEAGTQVIVLDDDPSIHLVWKKRLAEYRAGAGLDLPEPIHFRNGAECQAYFETRADRRSILFLCDYELRGEKKNGLQIIRELNLVPNSILVTSKFGDSSLHVECEQIGLRLLPKSFASHVRIETVELLEAERS